MLGDQGRRVVPLAQRRRLGLLLYHDAELRHERPSRRMRRTKWPAPRRRCLGCLAPLQNGSIVCSEECDDLWWEVVPTVSGELWQCHL
jgi:hypothetical protein